MGTDTVSLPNALPIYSDDFEANGLGNWWASNGSWEVGSPPPAGVGPEECYTASTQCAGTVLAGDYPNTKSNLVSPSINLPTIVGGQELHLRFWHWFSFAAKTSTSISANHDRGKIFIQEETAPGVWMTSPELTGFVGTSGGVWTKPLVDLSGYAGKKVRILFSLVNGSSAPVSSGWYIDDVTVDVVAARNEGPYCGDFESNGLGNWWESNDSWEVGSTPPVGVGPEEC